MKVESIAKCSLGAFCNTFDLHLAIIRLESQLWSSFSVTAEDRFYCNRIFEIETNSSYRVNFLLHYLDPPRICNRMKFSNVVIFFWGGGGGRGWCLFSVSYALVEIIEILDNIIIGLDVRKPVFGETQTSLLSYRDYLEN